MRRIAKAASDGMLVLVGLAGYEYWRWHESTDALAKSIVLVTVHEDTIEIDGVRYPGAIKSTLHTLYGNEPQLFMPTGDDSNPHIKKRIQELFVLDETQLVPGHVFELQVFKVTANESRAP